MSIAHNGSKACPWHSKLKTTSLHLNLERLPQTQVATLNDNLRNNFMSKLPTALPHTTLDTTRALAKRERCSKDNGKKEM